MELQKDSHKYVGLMFFRFDCRDTLQEVGTIDWFVSFSDVYYDVKPSAEECESVACNCAPASGCNEDCINRLVYSECSPQLCPCG